MYCNIQICTTQKIVLEYNHHKMQIVETENNAHSIPILELKT